MKTIRNTLLALAVAAVLAGCDAGRDASTTAGQEAATGIEKSVESDMEAGFEKARREMAEGNISLGSPGGAPKAEITPDGDFLIDGQPVELTAAQRQLVLTYRTQLADVASAGMDVGVQGAKLAARAVGEAVRGVFSGRPDEVEKRVEAQAEPIRQAALKLCDRLPALHEAQQQLAAALPAFAPYAKMESKDVDDCRRDALDGHTPAPPVPPSPPAAPSPPSA